MMMWKNKNSCSTNIIFVMFGVEIVPQAFPQENRSYSIVNILNTYVSKLKHVYAKKQANVGRNIIHSNSQIEITHILMC